MVGTPSKSAPPYFKWIALTSNTIPLTVKASKTT